MTTENVNPATDDKLATDDKFEATQPQPQPPVLTQPQYQVPQLPPQIFNTQVVQATGPGTNGMSVASMVLGIVGILLGYCMFAVPCILAVILGHVALVQIKRTGQNGRGMAITGLVLGYIVLGVLAAIFLGTVLTTLVGFATSA